MKTSREATTSEYTPVAKELGSLGYSLKIIKYLTNRHAMIRREIASAMTDMGDTHNYETRNQW